MNNKLLSGFFGLATLMATSALSAQINLDNMLGTNTPQKRISVVMACGNPDKGNCVTVVPNLARSTTTMGVDIVPGESRGSVQSATALCQAGDKVQTMVGQRDAIVLVESNPACTGKIHIISPGLYPYMAYLVTRRDSSARSLDDLVNNAPKNTSVKIAAGNVGSGGHTTLTYIVKANPKYKNKIQIVEGDQILGLAQVQSKQIDAYFVMDAPNSPLVEALTTKADAEGDKSFRFLNIKLQRDLEKVTDNKGSQLFGEGTIDLPGWFSDVNTITVDAVVAVSSKLRTSLDGPDVIDALVKSFDNGRAAIRAATNTPSDWK